MTNKEVIIFRVPTPQSEDDINTLKDFENKLRIVYENTNQIPLVVSDNIEVIKDNGNV
jgi:hypothetical protein